MALDKTGTITSGEPEVTDILPVSGSSEEELLRAAFALEQKSEHPLSKAILEAAREKGIEEAGAEEFLAVPGNGLTGTWMGSRLAGGNLKFIGERQKCGGDLPGGRPAGGGGKNPSVLCPDEKLLGLSPWRM